MALTYWYFAGYFSKYCAPRLTRAYRSVLLTSMCVEVIRTPAETVAARA
jgi:hypothetical protein